MAKRITATQAGKDSFTVTEDGKSRAFLPYAYLLSCAKAGLVVEIDRRGYQPAGEPPVLVLSAEN